MCLFYYPGTIFFTVYDPKSAGKTFQFEIFLETVIGNFPDKIFSF